MSHYRRTLDAWLANMHRSRARLETLVGAEHYRRFRTYLRVVRRIVSGSSMTLDVVVARAPE